eukprot:2507786-Alexandrium_andersonii.AAC.1
MPTPADGRPAMGSQGDRTVVHPCSLKSSVTPFILYDGTQCSCTTTYCASRSRMCAAEFVRLLTLMQAIETIDPGMVDVRQLD